MGGTTAAGAATTAQLPAQPQGAAASAVHLPSFGLAGRQAVRGRLLLLLLLGMVVVVLLLRWRLVVLVGMLPGRLRAWVLVLLAGRRRLATLGSLASSLLTPKLL